MGTYFNPNNESFTCDKSSKIYIDKTGLLEYLSNRRLSQVISADYFRRKHLSQSAVNDADAHYIGSNRRLSRAYFSSAEAGLK